jgi:hypothetical protein
MDGLCRTCDRELHDGCANAACPARIAAGMDAIRSGALWNITADKPTAADRDARRVSFSISVWPRTEGEA